MYLNFPGTNECADYPCKNGGTCLDLENDHFCVCAAGWSGDNCTISKCNNTFLQLDFLKLVCKNVDAIIHSYFL